MKGIFLGAVLLLFSCSAPREYTYKNRLVTKARYTRQVNRYTKRFVRSLKEEEMRLLLELMVVYDTTKQH